MTDTNFPDALAQQITTLTEKLKTCEAQVSACVDKLTDARSRRDDVKVALGRAQRAHAALTTTVKRTRKPKNETPSLFAEAKA